MKLNPFMLGVGVVAVIGTATFAAGWLLRSDAGDCGTGTVAGGTLGGPFELVSETGETVTDADVITRPSLVYFGYTFCPDVCPFDTARNADAVDLLAERGIDAQQVFVTVDPNRDTAEVLYDYTNTLQDSMIGLTGSQEQIDAAVRAYRVQVAMPEDTDDDYYTVGHSAFTYLVTPEDGFVEFFRREVPAEEMADRVACLLQ